LDDSLLERRGPLAPPAEPLSDALDGDRAIAAHSSSAKSPDRWKNVRHESPRRRMEHTEITARRMASHSTLTGASACDAIVFPPSFTAGVTTPYRARWNPMTMATRGLAK